MSLLETNATTKKHPDPQDLEHKWTDIVIRRPAEDIGKPLAEQRIKWAVRCVGKVQGADENLVGEDLSAVLKTADLIGLNATNKTKVKEFIKLSEKACIKENQTFNDDILSE
jgi:hypothetical protein